MVYNGFKLFKMIDKINSDIELIENRSLKLKFKELVNVIEDSEKRKKKRTEILRFIIDSMDYNSSDVKISNRVLEDITVLIQSL